MNFKSINLHSATVFLPLLMCPMIFALEPGEFYSHGPRHVKKIALTFDDGPGPETTKFLDLMDRTQVKATFFMEGDLAAFRGPIVKEVVKRGHEIGSHTSAHINYKARYKKIHQEVTARGGTESEALNQVKSELLADMKRAHAAIKKSSGLDVKICRMPNGIDRPWIKETAKEMGYTLINWSYGADWNPGSAEELLPGYLNALQSGAIFLFHDGGVNRGKSLALVEAVIKLAREKGYEIVPITQLLSSN